jgi:Family of unknown function (DUF6461)
MPAAESGWGWIHEVYPDAFLLSFFEGHDAGEVIAAFGIDPAEAEVMPFDEALEEYDEYPDVYRTGETGGWGFADGLVIVDHDEQLRRLSAGGRAVSVLRLASGPSGFAYFEDGERTCSFEPLFPAHRTGRDADRFVAEMRRVGLDPDGEVDLDRVVPAIAALDLVTELFGVRLDAETLRGPLLTGRVEPDLSWMDDDYVSPPIPPMPIITVVGPYASDGTAPGSTSVGE